MIPDNNKNGMHPEDMRNMLVFFVIAMGLYLAYNHFVVTPKADALAQAQKEKIVDNVRTQSDAALKTLNTLPRADAIAQSAAARAPITAADLSGSINLTGGRIDDIVLREYFETLDKVHNLSMLAPTQTTFPRFIEHGWVAGNGTSIDVPNATTQWTIDNGATLSANTPITLRWTNPQGIRFERDIAVDDQYMFTITQRVINTTAQDITLYPYAMIEQTGMPANSQGRYISHEGITGFIGDELTEIGYKNIRKDPVQKLTANDGWVGMTEKYWLTSIIPPQGQTATYTFKYNGTPKDDTNTGKYHIDFVGQPMTVAAGNVAKYTSHAFVGPKKIMTLREYGRALDIKNFDLAVDFGWLWFLSKPFSFALHYLGLLVGNMGVAIILLTIIIRSSVFPLTNTSYRSFAKMKKFSPQISELREKYGEDKVVLQKKIMELYQREGVNPMSGCIPIVLQIPIFFALYKTLFVTIEMRHAPFFGWIKDLSAPDPTSVFNLFGLIPWNPPAMLMIGVWPCLMLIGMIIQRRLNPPPQDPIQRDMMRYFPFIMAFVMAKFAAGLVIYWTFSAFIGLAQQIIIMRSMDVPIYLFGETPAEEKLDKQIDDGPAVHPLIDMAEDSAEKALFGDDADTIKPIKNISPPKPKRKTAPPKKKKTAKKTTGKPTPKKKK